MTSPADEVSVGIVPDFTRFPAQLQRGVDKSMRGVVASIDRSLRQAEEAAQRVADEIGRDFQTGGEAAELALRELAAQADRSLNQIDREVTATAATMSTRLRTAALAAGVAIAGIGVAAATGLGLLTGFGLKTAASLEQTTIGFEALLGSAEQAKVFLADLQQFAAKTPFEFQGLADSARSVLAFGAAVGITREEIIPTIRVIGDLAAVLGAGQFEIDSVVRALGQISSKGKVSQEELLQIAEAFRGFNANAAIANALGITTAEAMELISKGGVDAKTGIDALLQGMAEFNGAAGAMEKQAGTLLGVFSTFKDTVSIELANAFTPVLPAIKDTLAEITPVIGDAVGELAPALGELLAGALPLLASGLEAVTPILTELIGFFNDLITSGDIGPVLADVGAALGEIGATLRPLAPVLGKVIGALLEGLLPVVDALVPTLDELVPVIVELLEAFIPLIPSVFELAAAVLQILIPLAELTKLLLVDTHLIDVLGGVVQALAFIIGGAADAVSAFIGWLTDIDWGAVGDTIGGAFTDAWNAVSEFFAGIIDWLRDIHVQAINAFRRFRDAAVDRLRDVIAFVKSLPGRLVEAIGNLGRTLYNAGRDLVRGLWNGIVSVANWLTEKVRSFINDTIIGNVKDALGISSPSTVMANEVGREVPAGIGEGVADGFADLDSMLAALTERMVVGASNTVHHATTINMGGLHFVGAAPTEGQARSVGAAAMAGALAELDRRREVATTVRMA